MDSTARAQSEVIGVLLLTAVLVISMSVVGVAALENQSRSIRTTPPSAGFQTELNASTATLVSTGGQSLPLSDLDLVLRSSGVERIYDLEESGDRLSVDWNGDDEFDPGESVTVSHSLSGAVRMLLVDTSNGGSLLYDETRRLESSSSQEAPAIEQFTVTDTSADGNASYSVDWRTTDGDGDIMSATIELRNSDSGAVEDSGSYSFGGTGDTGTQTATLQNASGAGIEYEVELTVTDSGGRTATTRVFDTANADTTAPTITNLSATNPQGRDVEVSFESDEELSQINTTISQGGSRVAVLDETDFTTTNATAPFNYTATYTVSNAGEYNVTLNRAEDGNGNDGASGQNVTVAVADTIAPTISNFQATNPQSKDIQVSFDSDEELAQINVTISKESQGQGQGGSSREAVLDETDFSTSDTSAPYTYTATYANNKGGTFTATLNRAEDSSGNDGASGQSSTVSVSGSSSSFAEASGPYTVDEGQTVVLDGSSSSPQTGTPTYTWSIVSGPGSITQDTATPNATYVAPSDVESDTEVTVELIIDDNKETVSDQSTITVNDIGGGSGSDSPPTATIDDVSDKSQCTEFSGNSCKPANPNKNPPRTNTAEFEVNWSATDDNGVDSVTLEFVDSSGTTVETASGSTGSTTESGTVTFSETDGYGEDYTIRLEVTDSSSQSASDSVDDAADGNDP